MTQMANNNKKQVQIEKKGKEIKVVRRNEVFFSFLSVLRSGKGDDAAKL